MPLLTLPDTGSLGLSERAKALVFEDPKSLALLDEIRRAAPGDGPVLICGAPGTGRELVARHIHELGLRPTGPFLAVNCGAFPSETVEGELFGYQKNPARGQLLARPGWLESAHGGTLFLDAVGDLPRPIQARLLRALQDHQIVRIGARGPTPIDVRLLVASDVQLDEAVGAGHFRGDLLRFLARQSVQVPPLRERPGDILPLARHFLNVYQQRIGIGARSFDGQAERRLLDHGWPGNIRELETVVHHALLRCHGRFITEKDLRLAPSVETSPTDTEPLTLLEQTLQRLFAVSPPNLNDLIDETVIRSAYRFCQHNQLKTARLLGVSRNVVRARLIQYGEIAGFVRRSASGATRSTPPPAAEIVIGYQRVGLLMLVRARGLLEAAFAERGFAIRWAHYPSGVRLIDAFRHGELELGVVGEAPPIFAHANDVPIVYVAAAPPAPEGEAIVVKRESPIVAVRELQGKRVALVRGSSPHYLLIRALEEAGVDYGRVALRFLFQDAARVAFESGEVDAWVLGDPTLAEIQQTGRVRVLRDGRGLTENSSFYLASQRFAAEHPELVDVVRAELDSVARWVAENPDDAAETYAVRLGMMPEALGTSLKRGLGARLRETELIVSQQRIADAFYKLKLIPRPVAIHEKSWSARVPLENDPPPRAANS